MSTKMDLTGQKYGRLTVLYEVDHIVRPGGHKERAWRCLCECGTEKDIVQRSLINGETRSCGCLRKETRHNPHKRDIDLTNQRFGRWLVLYESEPHVSGSGYKERMWHCRCDCGTERDVSQHSLRKGSSLSCGCIFKDNAKEKRIDLTGRKFGRLTVMYEVFISDKYRYWHCRCECGNEKDVPHSSLLYGGAQSCGCYTIEQVKIGASKANKRYNEYDLSNSYGVGYTRTTNEPFYFDRDDYDLIKQYCWRKNDQGYIITTLEGKSIRMHRLIMNVLDNDSVVIDHINHNTVDNRKVNLRLATCSQNGINHKISTANTSGCSGVTWSKQTEAWIVNIKVQGKVVHIGTYHNLENAIAARKAAEEKYFGEYSYDNSQAIAELNKINA